MLNDESFNEFIKHTLGSNDEGHKQRDSLAFDINIDR